MSEAISGQNVGKVSYCGLVSSRPQPAREHALTDGVMRGRLFLSSYAPLFAILAARTSPWLGASGDPVWPSVASGVIAVIGFADGWWLIWASNHRGSISVVLLDVQDQGAAAAGYLPTYLLPFITSGSQSIGGWIGYGIYILILFVVFLGSDFAMVNPTLYVLGRRIARATIEQRSVDPDGAVERTEILVIARHLPRSGDTIRVTRLVGCWVEKEAPDGNS